MIRIFKGGKPDLQTKAMFGRVGKAMKVCGVYDL